MSDDMTSSLALAAELRAFLARTRVSLDEEIRTYPTPIPRCDAQFNFVYEQRARVLQWLNQLDAALTDKDGPVALAGSICGVPECGVDRRERRRESAAESPCRGRAERARRRSIDWRSLTSVPRASRIAPPFPTGRM